MKRVLTIGPSDSSGVTGIQADLRVFDALNVIGLSTVTEVRASDGAATRRRFKVPPRVIEAQIDAVARGGVDAAKISGLYDCTLVETLAARVRRRRLRPLVLDPGIVNERGERVLGRSGVEYLAKQLLPQAAVIVLRSEEPAILIGRDEVVRPKTEVELRLLVEIARPPDVPVVMLRAGVGEGPADWLRDERQFLPLPAATPLGPGERDRFTAALAARLAMGETVYDAASFAAEFARRSLGPIP